MPLRGRCPVQAAFGTWRRSRASPPHQAKALVVSDAATLKPVTCAVIVFTLCGTASVECATMALGTVRSLLGLAATSKNHDRQITLGTVA